MVTGPDVDLSARHRETTGAEARAESVVAVVVPHTHWDREWYAPFETMRFHLVQFLDEVVEVLERDPELPVFLLDGQIVILEDYLEVRRTERDRVRTLVAAGRLRPGPFYVQPDEFHVSGEALVRNLLVGIAVSREFGWVMREGYLPDTFGHVSQLPQILQGFGIETLYAMRGFGEDVQETGSQLWWQAPDGSRVLVEWLTESYSNAAILTDDPARMSLRHGILVRYDTLPELLERMASRARTRALLLLNGGDHLRVQSNIPRMVRSLNAGVAAEVRLGGLEEFHQLVAERPRPTRVIEGELRSGVRHDVFDGIGSTRTPLKRLSEQTEAHLTGVAERLDALATLADGRSSRDSLHYAWRELLKNHAHDSICGCSVDAVHEEMAMRFTKVGQVTRAVAEDALARLGARSAAGPAGGVGVMVVNSSAFPRSGRVEVDVVFDLTAPLGRRQFGWTQHPDAHAGGYRLLDPAGVAVPFAVVAAEEVTVADALNRRKELLRDRLSFRAADVPPLGTALYQLVAGTSDGSTPTPAEETTRSSDRVLENDLLRVEVEPEGTLAVTSRATGRRVGGLLELLDEGDAGDEYGFGPLTGDRALSSRQAGWSVTPASDPHALVVEGTLSVPASLTPDRSARSAALGELPVALTVRLRPGADRAEVEVRIDNRVRDHRVRLRFPTATGVGASIAETAYGLIRRHRELPQADDWQERPSGAFGLRRFVAQEDGEAGLQILTEGLYEYSCPADGVLDVTLLRGVGWMARLDHPRRPHKVGPQVRTPGAQCLGDHTFRLAIRPYVAPASPGELFRAAEEFSIPLQGWAVQGDRSPSPDGSAGPELGLSLDPVEAVLSALKTAEDGAGVVVRVFNSAAEAVTATLAPRFGVTSADWCDLEEIPGRPLEVAAGGTVSLPLQPGQIATVRLYRRTGTEQGGRR